MTARTPRLRLMLVLAALAGALAGAEARSGPILTRHNPTDWTLRVQIFLQSYPPRDDRNLRYTTRFSIDKAALVFPLPGASASHETHPDKVVSEVQIDNRAVTDTYTLLRDYQAGEGMARWDLGPSSIEELRLRIDIPMTTYETRFDEAAALKIRWPVGDWSPLAQSALRPQMFVESDHPDVQRLAQEWTRGAPRSAPPVLVAKELAARVMAHVQPNGAGIENDRNGRYAGFELVGAAEAARTGKGTPFDPPALLCAVYRAAGLPARVVIGFDIPGSIGVENAGIVAIHPDCKPQDPPSGAGIPTMRAWVEFLLFDEATGEETWVPMDIQRQREFATRPPPVDRPWKWLGNNPCLQYTTPISFHFHPPTTVVTTGPPALWGWLPLPAIPAAEHSLIFDAFHTPKRAVPAR